MVFPFILRLFFKTFKGTTFPLSLEGRKESRKGNPLTINIRKGTGQLTIHLDKFAIYSGRGQNIGLYKRSPRTLGRETLHLQFL